MHRDMTYMSNKSMRLIKGPLINMEGPNSEQVCECWPSSWRALTLHPRISTHTLWGRCHLTQSMVRSGPTSSHTSDRQMDGHYEVHYLTRSEVDNIVLFTPECPPILCEDGVTWLWAGWGLGRPRRTLQMEERCIHSEFWQRVLGFTWEIPEEGWTTGN